MSKSRVSKKVAVQPKSFAARLRALREQKHLLQRALADAAGVSVIQYGRYERGLSLPNSEALQRLSEALDVSGDYLLSGATQTAAKAKFEDLELMRMFQETQELSESDKDTVKSFLGAFLFKRRVQSMAR